MWTKITQAWTLTKNYDFLFRPPIIKYNYVFCFVLVTINKDNQSTIKILEADTLSTVTSTNLK